MAIYEWFHWLTLTCWSRSHRSHLYIWWYADTGTDTFTSATIKVPFTHTNAYLFVHLVAKLVPFHTHLLHCCLFSFLSFSQMFSFNASCLLLDRWTTRCLINEARCLDLRLTMDCICRCRVFFRFLRFLLL